MDNELKTLLTESFDRSLSSAERRRLDEALAADAALRRERDALLGLRRSVRELYPEPDPAFGKKVLARMRQRESFSGRIVALFPRVVAACLLLFLLTVLGTYLSSGDLTTDALVGTHELTVEDAYLLTME